MRLIDADAFDERVRAAGGMSEEELSEDFKDGVLAVLYMMSKQPTITAQPEKRTEERTETHACDCVSRRAAIDVMIADHLRAEIRDSTVEPDLSSYSDKLWRNAYERGKAEAEEKIIYCKDCVHHIDGFFCQAANHHTSDKDCCASVFGAERRTDETD